MQKILLFTAFAMFALTSCKKKSVSPSDIISASIDNGNESFNTGAVANTSHVEYNNGTTGGFSYFNQLTITGKNGTAPTADQMTISLLSDTIKVGNYYLDVNAPSAGVPSISYIQGSNIIFDDSFGTYPFTITITSISDTRVQGNFHGTLVSSSTGTTKTFQNGIFDVAIK